MKTTLHNHKALGTDEKPLIPNAEFKRLCEEAKSHNFEVCEEIMQKYFLTDFQKDLISQLKLC